MTLKAMLLDEVVTPEEIEAVYGSFAHYMHAKLGEFLANPDSPKLVGSVTATVEPMRSFGDHGSVRFTLRGFTE